MAAVYATVEGGNWKTTTKIGEYWLIDPDEKAVTVFDFRNNVSMKVYSFNEKIPMLIYDGKLKIDMKKIDEYVKNTTKK